MYRVKFTCLIGFFWLFGLTSCTSTPKKTWQELLVQDLQQEVEALIVSLDTLASSETQTQAQSRFLESRRQYKKIEPFVEYYFSGLSRRINGPALPEIEADEHQVLEASGFQVLEEILFSTTATGEDWTPVVRTLQMDLRFVKSNLASQPITEFHLYELFQHQLIRIATLGITGFDSPLAQFSLPETEAALSGLQDWYAVFQAHRGKKWDQTPWKLAQRAMQKATDFNAFDRLHFIQRHLMPLSEKLKAENAALHDHNPEISRNKAFYGTLSDLMQGKNLNPDAFSPYQTTKSTKAKVELGRQLFFDVDLSKSRTLSCASCHQPQRAFTDGKVVSTIQIHGKGVSRNTPTVLYAAFQKSLFYDMRSPDLENQIQEVFENPSEFNLSPSEIVTRIQAQAQYKKLMQRAYPDKKTLGTFEMRNALAAYLRSLMPFQAKLDLFFQGKAKLTQEETLGFNLFYGKAKCATCHFAPIYNGTQPPRFQVTESEILGVPGGKDNQRWVLDPDLGRYAIYPIDFFKRAFKTPTVRNVVRTAPYMHNGVYPTLEEVIHFYDVGGGKGLQLAVPNQTLPSDSLRLSQAEKQAIIHFLRALTDLGQK